MENRKTIAFYIGSLCKGGAERVITNLANHFYRNNYCVYVVTKFISEDEYELQDGIIRVVADISGLEITNNRIVNLYRRIAKMRSIWKEINPNIIVSFIGKNNFMTITSSRMLRIPVIVSVRSAPRREYEGIIKWNMAKILFQLTQGVILQTNQAKKEFSRAIQKKAVILSNPLNHDFVDRTFVSKKKKEIVAVGRIDNNKNQEMLILAFMKIEKEYPKWKLKLIGDGEKKQLLQDLVNENKLIDRIEFTGRQNDIYELIKDSSIFVLPSKMEGMPNALIEAMALGIACISTDCPSGGPADLINNDENGYLIEVDNEEELIFRLKYLMNHEEEVLRVGRNAKKSMEKYHPDFVYQEWQEYIEGFIKHENTKL